MKVREANQSIFVERNRIREEKRNFASEELPKHIDCSDIRQIEDYRNRISARRQSVSQYVNERLSRTEIEKSNGENAFEYFVNAVTDNSLILLDEPENSLSAMWQMELTKFLRGAVREFNCQFIIATHSPFLLSIPASTIYNLDANPITTMPWYELESIRCYYQLFKDNEHLFK